MTFCCGHVREWPKAITGLSATSNIYFPTVDFFEKNIDRGDGHSQHLSLTCDISLNCHPFSSIFRVVASPVDNYQPIQIILFAWKCIQWQGNKKLTLADCPMSWQIKSKYIALDPESPWTSASIPIVATVVGQPKPTNNFGHHIDLHFFFFTGIDAH